RRREPAPAHGAAAAARGDPAHRLTSGFPPRRRPRAGGRPPRRQTRESEGTPESVMLRHDGYVKVVDFGIAKVLEGSSVDVRGDLRVTQASALVGTVGYMSPEQLRGGAVDGRSDVWSLGVLLYEMATGRLPFAAKTAGAMIANILTAQL